VSAAPHLAVHELVDALDGTLDGGRAAHIAECPACAAQIEDLRAIAARAADVDIPEPPAFFWNQLSARVAAAVEAESPAGAGFLAWRQWRRPAVVLTAAAVLIALVSTLAGVWPDRSADRVPPGVALHTPDDAAIAGDMLTDIEQDEAWAVVRTLAEDLDPDEMTIEGVWARPGSTEHLTLGLSDPERIELARLLEEQLKGRTLPESVS
jgi:hypothetical protein